MLKELYLLVLSGNYPVLFLAGCNKSHQSPNYVLYHRLYVLSLALNSNDISIGVLCCVSVATVQIETIRIIRHVFCVSFRENEEVTGSTAV